MPKPNQQEELWLAINQDDSRTVRQILQVGGIDLEARDPNGYTSLMLAVFRESPKCLALLLDAGADPNTPGYGKKSVLEEAVKSTAPEGPEIVELLLRHGAKLKTLFPTDSLLHLAAKSGQLKTVQLLVAAGAIDLHAKGALDAGEHGRSLYFAALKHPSIIRYLIKQKVSPNVRDADGRSPLHSLAVMEDDTQVMEMLIKAGAKVNAACNLNATPLMVAAANNNSLQVELLLASGADPKATCLGGNTALHYVARQSWAPPNPSIITRLVDAGSDLEAVDLELRTPLHAACHFSRPETLEFLLERGANPNAIQKDGKTPLMLAAESGKAAMAELLLKAGANPECGEPGGKARDIAIENGHRNISSLLEHWHLTSKAPASGNTSSSLRRRI